MCEPLSIIAATLGIVSTAFKLGKDTYDLVARIRDTPEDIQRLATELHSLHDVLASLQKVLALEASKRHRSALPNDVISTIQWVLNDCIERFNEIQIQVRIYGTRGRQGMREFWKNLKWEKVKKGKVEVLINRLNEHKLTLGLACTLLNLLNTSQTADRVEDVAVMMEDVQRDVGRLLALNQERRLLENSPTDEQGESTLQSNSTTSWRLRRLLEWAESVISARLRSIRGDVPPADPPIPPLDVPARTWFGAVSEGFLLADMGVGETILLGFVLLDAVFRFSG